MARPGVTMPRSSGSVAATQMAWSSRWLDRFSRATVGEALRVHDEITTDGGSVIARTWRGSTRPTRTGEYALTNADSR